MKFISQDGRLKFEMTGGNVAEVVGAMSSARALVIIVA